MGFRRERRANGAARDLREHGARRRRRRRAAIGRAADAAFLQLGMAAAGRRRALRPADRRGLPEAARRGARPVPAGRAFAFRRQADRPRGLRLRIDESRGHAARLCADRRPDAAARRQEALVALPQPRHRLLPRRRKGRAVSRFARAVCRHAARGTRPLLGAPPAARHAAVRRGFGRRRRADHGKLRAEARGRDPGESRRTGCGCRSVGSIRSRSSRRPKRAAGG